MISRHTSSIPKEDVFPRLLYGDLKCFQVLPGAPEGHYISPVYSDPSPGWREACISLSEGTRFLQSHQSRPEHPGVSDGNWSCCWCTQLISYTLSNPSIHIRTLVSIQPIQWLLSNAPIYSVSLLFSPQPTNTLTNTYSSATVNCI